MTEYSRMAKGRFVSTGQAQIVNLPFRPDRVEFINYSAQLAAPAANAVTSGFWDSNMGEGFAATTSYNATPVLVNDVVTSNGISTFSAGLMLQYGPTLSVTSITKANPAVVTTSTNHNLKSGDVVVFQNLYETALTGMPQIDTVQFTVTVTGLTTFTIPWNTNQSEYTAITGAATGLPTVKKVLYPYLYFPGVSVISNITLGTTTTIDTVDAHNFVVGQQVAFRIPESWGTVQLNSLPNNLTPGAPAYGYVIAVTDYNTVIVNIDSSSYTPFNSNQPFSDVSGQNFAQIVAVGDVNTGGVPISSGSVLYPPPRYMPIGTTTVNTINGPAIQGAFVNNTSQGFIIGNGAGTNLASSVLVGTAGNIILWRAFLHDMNIV